MGLLSRALGRETPTSASLRAVPETSSYLSIQSLAGPRGYYVGLVYRAHSAKPAALPIGLRKYPVPCKVVRIQIDPRDVGVVAE